MSTERPTPHPTPDSQPYWDAARAGVLKLQRCTHCGTTRHYPQPVCARCWSLEAEWVEASGRGAVHSWTVAHHAFHPAFKDELPYTLVIVDLEEGPRAMARLDPGCTVPLRLGLPIRLGFSPDGLPVVTAA